MGACHGQALAGIGNLPQQLSPLEHNPSLGLRSKQLGMVSRNRRRVNNPGRGGSVPCHQRIVVAHRGPFALKSLGEVRGRFVVSAHGNSACQGPPRKRRHANAADAQKV